MPSLTTPRRAGKKFGEGVVFLATLEKCMEDLVCCSKIHPHARPAGLLEAGTLFEYLRNAKVISVLRPEASDRIATTTTSVPNRLVCDVFPALRLIYDSTASSEHSSTSTYHTIQK